MMLTSVRMFLELGNTKHELKTKTKCKTTKPSSVQQQGHKHAPRIVEQSQESLCRTLKQGDENQVGIMRGEKGWAGRRGESCQLQLAGNGLEWTA